MLNRYPDACIILFLKPPIEGQVKTRLIPDIGAHYATKLYRHMASHCVESAVQANLAPVQLWCGSEPSHEFISYLSFQHNLPVYQQQGVDLGQRMFHALSNVLVNYRYALIAGVDCPGLGSQHYRMAIQQLEKGCDAVIGPALDGGYVMLGLRRIHRVIFQDIIWGRDNVLENTRINLARLGYEWCELPILQDVDCLDDVHDLQRNAKQLGLTKAFTTVLDQILSLSEQHITTIKLEG